MAGVTGDAPPSGRLTPVFIRYFASELFMYAAAYLSPQSLYPDQQVPKCAEHESRMGHADTTGHRRAPDPIRGTRYLSGAPGPFQGHPVPVRAPCPPQGRPPLTINTHRDPLEHGHNHRHNHTHRHTLTLCLACVSIALFSLFSKQLYSICQGVYACQSRARFWSEVVWKWEEKAGYNRNYVKIIRSTAPKFDG